MGEIWIFKKCFFFLQKKQLKKRSSLTVSSIFLDTSDVLKSYQVLIVHCFLNCSFNFICSLLGNEGWQQAVRWRLSWSTSVAHFTLKTQLCWAHRKPLKGKLSSSSADGCVCKCHFTKAHHRLSGWPYDGISPIYPDRNCLGLSWKVYALLCLPNIVLQAFC